MPTPVDIARQCLAKEAAAALDDAIALAKRRNHAQTTSLHVISVLLALPSSLLRDACTRSRNLAYSQRRQFRALEFCVGVALGRVSVSKTSGDEPPVSNSLMAAIKRSQANQRRHPETFLLYQQQLNSNPDIPPSISAVKVELKHFVMSILDDPVVSRVFGDAGFQTEEMKFTVMSPPPVSRFSSTISRPPSQFLSDYKQTSFPFLLEDGDGNAGGNTQRISEVLSKPARRNPLLIGACAGDAYTSFLESLKMGETGILPKGVEGLNLISLEHEVSEFLNGRLSEATMEMKLKQVDEMMENRQGPGIIAHCGDLIAFVNAESSDLVSCVVTKLKKSLLNSCRKLWLIGFLAGDDVYKKLLKRVPFLETDWDLNLLPITSSDIEGKCSNSSLLRTFVPFGGLFSTQSGLGTSLSVAAPPLELCDWCNEKYEQEVSAACKGALVDKQPENPYSWLPICKISNVLEIKEGKLELEARVASLRRKWSDICQKLHAFQKSVGRISPSGSAVPSVKKFPFSKDCEQVGNVSKNNLSRPLASHQNIAAPNLDLSDIQQSTQMPMASLCSTHVATDLRLGTNHEFSDESSRKRKLREVYSGKAGAQVTHLSFFADHLDKQVFGKELEGPWIALAEKVYWQIDAIQIINRAVLHWRHGENKGCLWFTFLGPDKVGKLKTAALLSEIVFGPSGNFVCLDLSMENAIRSDSIVDHYLLKLPNLKPGRRLVVDCIAEELRKHPNSVVFLENVDKADILIQESLSLAIKTRKFKDSCGRIINIQGTIFVLESTILRSSTEQDDFKEPAPEFPMEKVVESMNLPLQLSVGVACDTTSKKNYAVNVWISGNDRHRSSANKRKMLSNGDISWKRSHDLCISHIDLNVPIVDDEVGMDSSGSPNDSDPSSSSSPPSSNSWLQELLDDVDENVVVFKPFDFDSAAREISMEISHLLQEDGIRLEIDKQVMCQMLAACWLFDDKKAFGVWIKQVLILSIGEMKRRCSRSSSSSSSSELVMKLEHYLHGSAIEEREGGSYLPARIHIG